MSATSVQDGIITYFQGNAALSAEFGQEIRKGFGRSVNLTEVGKMLRVAFVGSSDGDADVTTVKAEASYGFVVVIAFFEPDEATADTRKTTYDKLVRDAIDKDMSFNGACLKSEMGRLEFAENYDVPGAYYGTMPLVCEKRETRGAR